jgi:2,5-diketo-D-gluconate reductase B
MIDEIPEPGLGTWKNIDPEECADSVETAINTGYRHIDTAQIYKNEEAVGKGLEGFDRQDYFLASKIWIDKLNRSNVISSTEKSLSKLGVEKVDLMYVHWPAGKYRPEESLNAMKELVERDMARYIGISNFTAEGLDRAMGIAGEHIIANQVEMHPLLQQEKLLERCRDHGIDLVAYSPLARGKVFEVPELQEIAEKHGASEAQVSLAWLMQKEGVKPIPKATSRQHIQENYEALELELDEEDIDRIDSIEREKRTVDPEFAPWR